MIKPKKRYELLGGPLCGATIDIGGEHTIVKVKDRDTGRESSYCRVRESGQVRYVWCRIRDGRGS